MATTALEVTFRSLSRSGREWTARFELDSEYANGIAALRHAFNMNASILRSREVQS